MTGFTLVFIYFLISLFVFNFVLCSSLSFFCSFFLHFCLPFVLCSSLALSSLPSFFLPFPLPSFRYFFFVFISSSLLLSLSFSLPLSFLSYLSLPSVLFLPFALAFFLCFLSLSFLIHFFTTQHFTIKDSVTVTSNAGSYNDSIKQDISGSARVSPGCGRLPSPDGYKNNILLVFFNRNQQEKEVFTAVRGVDSGHPHTGKQLYQ